MDMLFGLLGAAITIGGLVGAVFMKGRRKKALLASLAGFVLVVGAAIVGGTSDRTAAEQGGFASVEEKAFCKVIEENRAAYKSAAGLHNEIARKAAIDRAVADNLAKLKAVGGDGAFKGWQARVRKVSTHFDGSAAIELELPCEAMIKTSQPSGINPGAKLFDVAAGLKVGSKIEVDGQLVPTKSGPRPFIELSFFDEGRFVSPEFVVVLTALRP